MEPLSPGVYFLDITMDVCPMTLVRVKLLMERMPPGAILEVRLTGREPLENLPASLTELGHTILSVVLEPPTPGHSARPVHQLTVRKSAG